MPTRDRESAILEGIRRYALSRGFDEDAARVLMSVALTEGGMSGAVGDNGNSFGIYQFYRGGQLPNYAKHIGGSVDDAINDIRTQPMRAAQWAIDGYLGNSVRRGQQQGIRGPDLATYAQRHGQVSVNPEKSGANYRSRFSGDTVLPNRISEEPDNDSYPDTVTQKLPSPTSFSVTEDGDDGFSLLSGVAKQRSNIEKLYDMVRSFDQDNRQRYSRINPRRGG